MARTAEIIGTATDWLGKSWEVRERRPTTLGFDILIGWPVGATRGRGGRGVATIPTAELAHYLSNTRLKDIELPLGATTINRLRQEIGVKWSWDDWWAARNEDLLTLTLEVFCAKHGGSIGAASQRRSALRK